MKKLISILFVFVLIISASGCAKEEEVEFCYELEEIVYTDPTQTYVVGVRKEDIHLLINDYKLYRVGNYGRYEYIMSYLPNFIFFIEDDKLYELNSNYVQVYDLTDKNPESTREPIQILPGNVSINYLIYRNKEYFYVNVRVKDSTTNTMDQYYKTKRDGSGWQEISFDELPKPKNGE